MAWTYFIVMMVFTKGSRISSVLSYEYFTLLNLFSNEFTKVRPIWRACLITNGVFFLCSSRITHYCNVTNANEWLKVFGAHIDWLKFSMIYIPSRYTHVEESLADIMHVTSVRNDRPFFPTRNCFFLYY